MDGKTNNKGEKTNFVTSAVSIGYKEVRKRCPFAL